jgi:hypothetical protein
MRELILMAPMQAKPKLGIGNLYDLAIIDFLAKCRRIAGSSVSCPTIWNVNGLKTMQLAAETGAEDTQQVKNAVSIWIAEARRTLASFSIELGDDVRDDNLSDDMLTRLNSHFDKTLQLEALLVCVCSKCNDTLGSDPGIKTCRKCGAAALHKERATLFIVAEQEAIEEKANRITFFPLSSRAQLLSYSRSLPKRFALVVEKDRLLTVAYRGIPLDPRHVAVSLPSALNARAYEKVTLVHGDIIKKYDYYAIVSLGIEDLPQSIVCHGPVVDRDGKKLRWQLGADSRDPLMKALSPRILRCLFLKSSLRVPLKLGTQSWEGELRGLRRLFAKADTILKSTRTNPVSEFAFPEPATFLALTDALALPEAFETFRNTVDAFWLHAKAHSFTPDQRAWLSTMVSLYFGCK